jgi:hypothetical protein
MKKMFYYAKGIRRLQRELKTSVSEFPQFGLIDRITADEEEEQNWLDRSYTETQNELEELNQDPYRIQLLTEQEQYFRRILQDRSSILCIEDGTS